MRSAASGLVTLLARDETNYTFIAEITKRNSDVIRLSACVGDITFDGDTFYGTPGFSLTTITSAAFGQPPAVDIEIPVSTSGPITPDDITFGALDSADVDIWMLDYSFPDDGRMAMFRGKISAVEISDTGAATFQIEGYASDLMELVVETYSTTCPASLGDSRCQKNLTAFTHSATVSAVTSRSVFTLTSNFGKANGWFANGALKFTSGANDGFAFDIRSWTQSSARVDLWLPAIKDVAPGDTLQIVAGCDKLPETCRTKFDNIINFQGFPFLPLQSDMECGEDGTELEERPPVGSIKIVEC